jgi:hypothetical protein
MLCAIITDLVGVKIQGCECLYLIEMVKMRYMSRECN